MFVRPLVREGAMVRPMNAGDGLAANYRMTQEDTDGNTVISVAKIAGGLILRGAITANRTDTTATAALIAAAFPDMNIGDTLSFKVSNQDTAQTITVAGGTGVTASGNLVVVALRTKEFVLVKTAAATFNLIGL